MSATLFPAADAHDGDPLRPSIDVPTPPEIVAGLTASQRRQRLDHLIEQAWFIYDEAIHEHSRGRRLAASCVLYSGGNDSTVLAHLMRGRATHAIHANTGIGIEETRQFVRDTCASWGLPLVEEHAGDEYERFVLEHGFPGPAMHARMYQRLKERCLDAARHTLGFANSRSKYALFIAGRRRQESDRREDIPMYEPDGTVVWVSPLVNWTALDLMTYRLIHAPVPLNPVSANLHMSGECLCGSFAKPGELDEIGFWYPLKRAELESLQERVQAAGIPAPWNRWGHGQGKARGPSGRLCSSCDARQAVIDIEGGAA